MLQKLFSCECAQKHIRNFDKPFWKPAAGESNHSLVELVTGTRIFLTYLECKWKKFRIIDNVPRVLDSMPKTIADEKKLLFYLGGIRNI